MLLHMYFPLKSLFQRTSIGMDLILARYLELNHKRLNLKCEVGLNGLNGTWLIVLEVMRIV